MRRLHLKRWWRECAHGGHSDEHLKKMNGYTRRRRTYSFRAWVDASGSNVDRLPRRRGDTRLWDLNRTSNGHNIIRILRRRSPLYLRVMVGRRLHTVFRAGLG